MKILALAWIVIREHLVLRSLVPIVGVYLLVLLACSSIPIRSDEGKSRFLEGAALAGITIVCGENVCGIDPDLKLNKDKKIVESPEMDRRIDLYKRYYDGYGELLVQMNVEDTRLGVGE